PEFPEALDWLRDHQLSDGSWGTAEPVYAHGNTLSTLATILALKQWNNERDYKRIKDAVSALWKLAKQLPREKYERIGFELILPSLLEEAQYYQLKLPYEDYEKMYKHKTAEKLALIQAYQEKHGYAKPHSWWHSLELLGGLSLLKKNLNQYRFVYNMLGENG